MSLLHFLKPKDGLPDSRGALSTSIPSAAIAQANQEVQKAQYQQRKAEAGTAPFYSPRRTYPLCSVALVHKRVPHQQLLPKSRDVHGSPEHSRLFGERVRSRSPPCYYRLILICTCEMCSYFRVKFFSWVLLTHEKKFTRKFVTTKISRYMVVSKMYPLHWFN